MDNVDIIGDFSTPAKIIEKKYYRAKKICLNIWENPKTLFDFEDIFHNTLYNCLKILGGDSKLEYEFMKKYFFKAFRINMIRYFGYSYNKKTSGIEIEKVLIPVDNNYETHMDGFLMLDYVLKKYGNDTRNLLWDNLNGTTYKELDSLYDVNSFYVLNKVKNDLKAYYKSYR